MQVVVDTRDREPGQLGRAACALQRTGQHRREPSPLQQPGDAGALPLADLVERHVGESGVPTGVGPLGAPVPHQHQVEGAGGGRVAHEANRRLAAVLIPVAAALCLGAGGLAVWSLVNAVRGVRPSKAQLVAAAVLAGALLLQTVLGLVLLATTDRDVDVVTFVGYHLTALAVLVLGVGWGIADRSRWGNGVFAIAAATQIVLVLRLVQIWDGRG